MNEGPPNQFETDEREQRKREIIALARELAESQEVFPFPGIDSEAYLKIRSGQEEFPGYATPIDELLERFENEGMKVVLGTYHESGNVFILPAGSNDIVNDNLFPRHLQMSEIMDEKLKKLIVMNSLSSQEKT